MSNIRCIGFNVTGADIADRNTGMPSSLFTALYQADTVAGSSYCSYPGIIAGPFSVQNSGITATIPVPVGYNRLVQAVGIVSNDDSTACTTTWGATGPTSSGSNGDDADFYEIGRAKVGTLFSDSSVNIQGIGTYDPGSLGQYKVNCGDNGDIIFDSSGPTVIQSGPAVTSSTGNCTAPPPNSTVPAPFGTSTPSNYVIYQLTGSYDSSGSNTPESTASQAAAGYDYSNADGLANVHRCVANSSNTEVEIYKFISRSSATLANLNLELKWHGAVGSYSSGSVCSSAVPVAGFTAGGYFQIYLVHTQSTPYPNCPSGSVGWWPSANSWAVTSGTPDPSSFTDLDKQTGYPAECFMDANRNFYVAVVADYTSGACEQIQTDRISLSLY